MTGAEEHEDAVAGLGDAKEVHEDPHVALVPGREQVRADQRVAAADPGQVQVEAVAPGQSRGSVLEPKDLSNGRPALEAVVLRLHPGEGLADPAERRGIVPLGVGEDGLDGKRTRCVDGVDPAVPELTRESKAELLDFVAPERVSPGERGAVQAIQACRTADGCLDRDLGRAEARQPSAARQAQAAASSALMSVVAIRVQPAVSAKVGYAALPVCSAMVALRRAAVCCSSGHSGWPASS